MNKKMRCGFLLIISIDLISCDGSGGSSSSATSSTPITPTISAFTTWSATTPNVPVAMTGGISSSIDLIGNISQSDSAGAGTFNRDASNYFTLINPTASEGNSAIFSTALGDTLQSAFDGATTVTLNKAQATIGIFLNPTYYAFQYQTYGAWGSYGNATGNSFALSDGSASPVSAIPAIGGLSYSGGSAGYYVDKSKLSYVTNANMVATLSSDSQKVIFSSSNTLLLGGPNGTATSNVNLDLTGTLALVAGTNYFSGTVTANNGMTGKINGELYGPGVNEFGGTYAIFGSGAGTIVGSFGSKR